MFIALRNVRVKCFSSVLLLVSLLFLFSLNTYANQTDGYVKKILQKNMVDGVNTLTQEMINDANTIYVIKYEYRLSESILVPKSCILQFKGGCLNGGGVRPNKTIIKGKKRKVLFKNVSFNTSSDYYFENSRLTAKNFGFVSDMRSVEGFYSFDGKIYKARIRKGTSNNDNIKQVAAFCSFSKNVSIELKGKYVGDASCNIWNATSLELYGGTLQAGLCLIDCKYCSIHDLNIVGYHEIHDFPEFNPAENTWYQFGLVPQYGIMCKTSKPTDDSDDNECRNINVYNCHMEMRMAGVHFGDIDKQKRFVYRPKNCHVYNCSGDHLIWQLSGMHAIDCTAENLTCNYAFQAYDLSTGCIRCTVSNSCSSNVFVGGKMQGEDNYVSYGNKLTGIKEVVNDVFPCVYDGGTYGAFINHCEGCTISDYEIIVEGGHKYAPLYINNVSGAHIDGIKIRTQKGGHVTTVINYYMPTGDIHIKNVDAICVLSGNNIVNVGKPANSASMYLSDSSFDVRREDKLENNFFFIPAKEVVNCTINTNNAYLHTVKSIKDSRIKTKYIENYQDLSNCDVIEQDNIKNNREK